MIPRQTMLIDIYIAPSTNEPEQGRGERVPPVPEVGARAGVLAQNGYRPVNQKVLKEFAQAVPDAPRRDPGHRTR